jgi:hypothetical protein
MPIAKQAHAQNKPINDDEAGNVHQLQSFTEEDSPKQDTCFNSEIYSAEH